MGYKDYKGVTGNDKGLRRVTEGYNGLQGFKWVRKGYRRLLGVTRRYKGLHGVTVGYRG